MLSLERTLLVAMTRSRILYNYRLVKSLVDLHSIFVMSLNRQALVKIWNQLTKRHLGNADYWNESLFH